MAATPCYSKSQVVSVCQSFRPVAPFFFSGKVPFVVFLIQKGIWPYRHAYDIPLMTVIRNIYAFAGQTSTVQA